MGSPVRATATEQFPSPVSWKPPPRHGGAPPGHGLEDTVKPSGKATLVMVIPTQFGSSGGPVHTTSTHCTVVDLGSEVPADR